jgi:hypothetical protein
LKKIQVLPANIPSIVSKDKKICAGKDCNQKGKHLLKVVLINKLGYFCDNCRKDLFDLDLVEMP